MPIEFHPAAIREAAAAYRWYAARSSLAAVRFAQELDDAIDAISKNPGQPALFLAGTRRVLFRRFPYLIVYREQRGRIQVLAIAHAKRRPGYWNRRE